MHGYRFGVQVRTTQQREQAYLYTSAGASKNLNPISTLVRQHPEIDNVHDEDHKTCGGYLLTGDDSDAAHLANMQKLGEELTKINPNIKYEFEILRLQPEYKDTHHCPATAFILGDREVLRIAFERMEQEGLTGKFDIIARPFALNDLESILEDLRLSAKLHRDPGQKEPFKIFIFDRDEDNAMILKQKAKSVVPEAKVESIVVQEAAEEENVA